MDNVPQTLTSIKLSSLGDRHKQTFSLIISYVSMDLRSLRLGHRILSVLGEMMRKLKDSSPALETMLATGQFSVWCKLLTAEHCQYLDWLVIENRPRLSLFHMQYPQSRVKRGFKLILYNPNWIACATLPWTTELQTKLKRRFARSWRFHNHNHGKGLHLVESAYYR